MASPRIFPSLFFFFLNSFFFFFISPCQCDAQNVTLSVYYEALCPYCADFIVNHMVKLFDGGLNSIVNLRMVPWGNAVMQPDGTFLCQHGPEECLLNSVQACTIVIYPYANWHFNFIQCVERLTLQKKSNEWVKCFDMSRLGTVPIDCYKSGYGNEIEKKYAAETAELNPPHKFVPWVLVNGQPLQEDFKNFVTYVCKAYQGPKVPAACQSTPPTSHSLNKATTIHNPVCYAN